MFAFGETVVRQRAQQVPNPAGNDTLNDWANPVEQTFAGIAVAPGATFETAEPGRTPLSSDFTLYGPSDWDVAATDRVVVRGEACEVVGEPFSYVHPMTGWAPGTVVNVRKRQR